MSLKVKKDRPIRLGSKPKPVKTVRFT